MRTSGALAIKPQHRDSNCLKMKCEFSFAHYIETLLRFKKNNYKIGKVCDFNELAKNDSFIILRHDVDFSLEHALKIAKIEARIGLQSTYFILLHSPYYNALSKSNMMIIKEISSLGHEIGLHYDTDLLHWSVKKTNSVIQNEISIIEMITNKKVMSIAQHNTSIAQNRLNLKSYDLIDANSNTIQSSVTYISDSVQNWRSGCMCNHVMHTKKLQILTHPIWWDDYQKPRDLILNEIIQNSNNMIKSEILNTKMIYKQYLKKYE